MPRNAKAFVSRLTAMAAIFFFSAPAAIAADPYLGMESARGFGLPTLDIRMIATNLIRAFMSFLGLILLSQVMWGGFLMMTHGGNEDRKKKAASTIKDGVVGMFLILSASSIVKFVVYSILNATGTYL